jgi:serine/threonine protein kinase
VDSGARRPDGKARRPRIPGVIKPSNIFVSSTGTELDFVKVLDFGLVRLRSIQTGVSVSLTGEAAVACTPAYAAPEIARGNASYDHRVDIYAVGCVAYWLLSGQLVFDAKNSMEMLFDHASTPPARVQTRTELPIPLELEDLIMECLEKDPDRRPAGANLLAQRLSACQFPEPWTRERAEQWWHTHAPTIQPEYAPRTCQRPGCRTNEHESATPGHCFTRLGAS